MFKWLLSATLVFTMLGCQDAAAPTPPLTPIVAAGDLIDCTFKYAPYNKLTYYSDYVVMEQYSEYFGVKIYYIVDIHGVNIITNEFELENYICSKKEK